jgi:hypothetical protein
MNQMSDEDAYELLHEAGFSVLEIYRIIQQRRNHTASQLDQASPVYTRPRFLQWRLWNRRLADQTAQKDGSTIMF